MKKLSLDLDELQVESFDTRPAVASHAGTVRAREATEMTQCYQNTCAPTCDAMDTCWRCNESWDDGCYESQWPCSLGGPQATQCDLSCEFECTGVETCSGHMC